MSSTIIYNFICNHFQAYREVYIREAKNWNCLSFFRMDDKQTFTEEFDCMIDEIVCKTNKKNQYHARATAFGFKKHFPDKFEFNEEEFQKEQEELEKDIEPMDQKAEKKQKMLFSSC